MKINFEQLISASVCIDDFTRNTQFKKRSSFSGSRITKLSTAIASAADMCTRPVFDLREKLRARLSSKYLEFCHADLLFRRKIAMNTTERNFGPESVASSVIENPINSNRLRLRVSNVFEVRDLQMRADGPHIPDFPGSSRGLPSPGGRKESEGEQSSACQRITFFNR